VKKLRDSQRWVRMADRYGLCSFGSPRPGVVARHSYSSISRRASRANVAFNPAWLRRAYDFLNSRFQLLNATISR